MHLLNVILYKAAYFLFFQPGELPVPKKSKENQIFGNYTLGEFLNENWIYISGILLLIILLIIYKRHEKKEKQERENN